jgi:hypothetical protein
MKIIRYILAVALFLYIAFATHRFFNTVIFQEEITRCGLITFKSSYDQKHKHSTSVEFVLVVKYDDTGRKEDEDVSASTWSSYSVGDRICFTTHKRVGTGFWSFINFLAGGIGFLVILFSGIILFILFIRWIFTGKFLVKFSDDND